MATNTELVQQLYVAYFNRPADVRSLEYYVSVLNASADPVATAKVISKDFANATEYKSVYANLTAEATVNTIYHNLFGHEADIPGLKYWADLYRAGTITLAEIVTSVAAGAQGTDATAYNNKVAAAASFTSTIALSADQQLAYESKASALAIAQAYLAGVTDDASLAAAIADVATTASSVVPFTTATLTAGVDNLTGTSGNDVFNTLVLNTAGTASVLTLQAGDTIDGGAGTNTLNVANGGAGVNDVIQGTFKNIQIFNIDNTSGAAAATTNGTVIDASKLGTAAKQIWQIASAAEVTNLGASTTAGFKGTDTSTTAAVIGVASTVTAASIAVKDVVDTSKFEVAGTKLATVNLSGNVVDNDGSVDLKVTAGAGVQTITVNAGLETTLTVVDGATVGKEVTSVNLGGSTGDVTFVGGVKVATIKGGSGADTLTIGTTTVAAATGVTAVTANIDAGAGDNKVDVKTTGTGLTNVVTGAGDDTVHITTRSDGKLTVNLGAGNDTFTSDVAILATDVIDAGAGTDTLLLQLVGSNNIGAFSNFDAFDTFGLTHALDVNILSAKNNVTEFVTSGDLSANAQLDNIGANIGFRVTGGDDLTNAIKLNQATAGAITLTVDADESGTDAITGTGYGASVATNATSVKAVFDTKFVGEADGAGDNIATLKVSTAAATAVTVTSGGENASNVLTYADTAAKLASITVTGASELTLGVTVTGTSALATVDASAATGGLNYNVASLKVGGVVKLGSGADVITITGAGADATKITSLSGFEKAAAAAVGTDADAAEAAIADADVVVVAAATVAADAAVGALANTTDSIKDGVLTFGGSGPATLAAAILRVQGDVAAVNESVVFTYLGDTYVFSQGALVATSDDVVVKLTGVTGVTELGLDTSNAGHLFIV